MGIVLEELFVSRLKCSGRLNIYKTGQFFYLNLDLDLDSGGVGSGEAIPLQTLSIVLTWVPSSIV